MKNICIHYTSIGLLKPPETVIGEDGRLAGESSSAVIPSMPVKLEPIAEEQLEGDAFKGDGNEECSGRSPAR